MISYDTLGLLLDVTALALAAGYVVYRLRDRRIVIDHRILFSVGHAYYLSLPLIMARVRILDGQYRFVWAIFDRIPDGRALLFSTWSLTMLLAFHAGCMAAQRWPARPVRVAPASAPAATYWIPIVAVGFAYCIFFLVTILNLSVIRSGYRSNDPTLIQSQTGRGTLAAAATLVGGTLIYARSRLRDVAWPMASSPRSATYRNAVFGAAFLPVAAVLLLAGGRLYITTVVLAGVVWVGVSVRPFRRTTIVAGGIIVFVMLTAYGAVRTGDTPNAADMQLFSTTEGVQGAIALFNTLEDNSNQFDAVRMPVLLASDMVNVVPRLILPNKDDIRITPDEIGFNLDNPLGGLNAAVSLLVNFGSAGSLVAIFLLGAAMTRLRRAASAPRAEVLRVTYSIITATLLMVFYRDFFGISIVRWWILTAMLVPLAVTVATKLVAPRTSRKGSHVSRNDDGLVTSAPSSPIQDHDVRT